MATSRKSPKSAHKTVGTAQDRMMETMNQIWLAGLGALSKARSGTPQLLQELVSEGTRVQSDTYGAAEKAVGGLVSEVKASFDSRMNQVRDQAGDMLENLENIFQTRVQQALTQLGVPTAEALDRLSKRVDKLGASIAKQSREQPRVAANRARLTRKPAASTHPSVS